MKIKKLAVTLSAAFFVSTTWASDVFIDQIGDDVQIDITQRNGMNIVNTDGDPAIISGDGIVINMLQDGDLNTADINLDNADGTDLNYSAVGSLNDFTVDFAVAVDNVVGVSITGDNNTISVCGDLACNNSASVDDTVNVVNVNGDYNTVRFALNATGALNTVNITGGSIKAGNSVDITQSSGANHVTNIGIVGGNNAVTIIQGQ